MGGYGSGRWHGHRATVRGCLWFDVRDLQRRGMFCGNACTGDYTWNRDGEATGSMKLAVDQDARHMTVTYSHRKGDSGPWQHARHEVRVDLTACGYGGRRRWFACPRCGDRRAVLVVAGEMIGCRRCLRLTYGTQYEQKRSRALYRMQEMEKKYPSSDPYVGIAKPPGMWRSTWDRILDRWERLAEADNEAFYASMQGILGRSARR